MMKTILITGSTDGIGKLAAIKLATAGHKIFVHGRNSLKLKESIAEIKTISKNEHIDGFLADFSDLDDVKQMASKISEKIPKIDVLINNAGVFKAPATERGIDLRFIVNYLAPYLLTNKLMPLLKKGLKPRVINLSSAAQSSVSIDALKGKMQLSDQAAYAQSKLALTIWSFNLAKMHHDLNVIAVNPGSLLNTKMALAAYGQFWSSAEKGGDILTDLAISEVYSKASGKYFDNDKGGFNSAHADAYDALIVEKLMQATDRLLGL